MNIVLYYAPMTCATVPYILLTEAGADFSVEPVNLQQGAQMRPEFLRLNPKHKVPVLVVDGTPITENIAIQMWIARTFPGANLLPADPLQELRAISITAWCASAIHPSLTPNVHPQRYCDLPGSEESVRRCAQKLLLEHYQVADDLLAGREWFFDRFGAPDAYFFWCFRAGVQLKLDTSRFKNCHGHLARMQERPSVRKLQAYEPQVAANFANR